MSHRFALVISFGVTLAFAALLVLGRDRLLGSDQAAADPAGGTDLALVDPGLTTDRAPLAPRDAADPASPDWRGPADGALVVPPAYGDLPSLAVDPPVTAPRTDGDADADASLANLLPGFGPNDANAAPALPDARAELPQADQAQTEPVPTRRHRRNHAVVAPAANGDWDDDGHESDHGSEHGHGESRGGDDD